MLLTKQIFMKKIFNKIRNDKILSVGFLGTILFTIITVLYTLIFFRSLPPFVPLFNQLPWGERRLGIKTEIFTPPFIVSAVLLVNVIFCVNLYDKMPLVSRIVSITTLLVSIFDLLFIIRTIGLVL